jgi:hypothetical protein
MSQQAIYSFYCLAHLPMWVFNVIMGSDISARAYFMLCDIVFLILITSLAGNLISFSHRQKKCKLFVCAEIW